MVTFILRFYGRFVLARERKAGSHTGNATFIAPSLEFPPEIGPHRPIVTVDRRAVSSDLARTSVPPTFRAIPGTVPNDSEYLMWDLTGTSLRVPSSGGFTLTETDLLPDLTVLEGAMGRQATLNQSHLKPGALTAATIAFRGGAAVARATVKNAVQFVPEDQAREGSPIPLTVNGLSGLQMADWIEVALKLPGVVDAFGVERACLGLALRGRLNGTVTIDGPDQTQISFSNLCSTCPRTARQFDLEFGQFYELLDATSIDRLIPSVSHLGNEDCNDPSQISYDI